jgi:hypothetical protein
LRIDVGRSGPAAVRDVAGNVNEFALFLASGTHIGRTRYIDGISTLVALENCHGIYSFAESGIDSDSSHG